MAALGTMYWGYGGTHGGTRDNIVGVMGDAWRYWGAVWWEHQKTLGGTGVSPLTPRTTRGGTGASPGPSNKLEGQCLRACT